MDVKEAVTTAISQVQVLYAGQDIRDLLLEEIEKVDNQWHVTVSFLRPSDSPNAIRGVFGPEFTRAYKIVELNAFTGELLSMRIRKT